MQVLEVISSLIQALPCKAGIHRWSALDPRIYGKAIGCLECGQVWVDSEGPSPSPDVNSPSIMTRSAA